VADFLDTFTTSGVDEELSEHTPDIGGGWVELPGKTYDAGIIAAKARGARLYENVAGATSNQNSSRAAYKISPDPTSEEYDITVSVVSHDWTTINTYTRGFFGRKKAGEFTAYVVRILTNGHVANSVTLYKVVNNSATELASFDAELDDFDTIKLEIRDAAKKVYHNGVEIISSSDNDITGGTEAGLFWGQAFGLGGHIDRRQDFDSFELNLVGGGTGPVNVAPERGSFELQGASPSTTYGALSTIPDGVGFEYHGIEPTTVLGPLRTEGGTVSFEFAGSDPTTEYGALAVMPAEVAFDVSVEAPNTIYGPLTAAAEEGAFLLAGGSPQAVFGPVAVAPPEGGFTLHSEAPVTILGPLSVAPDAGAYEFAGLDPGILYGAVSIVPDAGAFELFGTDPSVEGVQRIVALPGAFGVAGRDPTTEYGALAVVPDTGAFEIVGADPSVHLTVSVVPAAGQFAVAGRSPGTVLGPLVTAPEVGELEVVGTLPKSVFGPVTVRTQAGQYLIVALPGTIFIGERSRHAHATVLITRRDASATITFGRASVEVHYEPTD